MLWVTTVVFGLMHGGAVIQEEARQGDLTGAQLDRLHVSIGMNHSIVEDSVLFMALGPNGFWLWVPKLVAAAPTAHIFRLAEYLAGGFRRRSGMPG